MSFRLFKDFDLTLPIASITPARLNPSLIDIARIETTTPREIEVYDEEQHVQVAFKAWSGYKVSNFSANNPIFDTITSSAMLPLSAFTCTPVEDEVELYNDTNKQSFYTEGRTKFDIWYGETPYVDETHQGEILIWISPAYIYTQGPTAGQDGYETVTIRNETANYSGYVASYFGVPRFIAIDKAIYRHSPGTIKIQFIEASVKFPNEPQARKTVLAITTAEPTSQTPGEERPRDIMGVINLYTDDVFQGVDGYQDSYAPTDNNVHRGGTGSGFYPHSLPEGYNFSQMISQRNTALNGTMSSTGEGLSYYVMDSSTFSKAMNFAYGNDSIFGSIGASVRLSALVGAYLLPLSVTGTEKPFYLANAQRSLGSGCKIVTTRLVWHDFGAIDLGSYGWDDFNDFTNTRAVLTLPFVGNINIDMNAIARGALTLKCAIDVTNGNIGYWVFTTSMEGPGMILYGTYTGNCAMTQPTSGTYKDNPREKIMNVGSSIATGNPVSIGSNVVSSVINAEFKDIHVDKGGSFDSFSASVSEWEPQLIIEKREMLRAENYTDVDGIPAFATVNLNELSGFVQVHSIDISNIDAEDSEKEELVAMLKEGVWI